MLKKILIIAAVVVVTLVIAMNILAKSAPGLLRSSIEKALNKKVLIRSIEYKFPSTFELSGFEVREEEDFKGEISFYVDRVNLNISLFDLMQKKIGIDKVEIKNAQIVVRRYQGKLTHVLSSMNKHEQASPAEKAPAAQDRVKDAKKTVPPLKIREFILERSSFRYIDYDAQSDGFVIALEPIDANIRNISLPPRRGTTSYKVQANLVQGRDQQPAVLTANGQTEFVSKDTKADFEIGKVYLPYFQPYYGQVTGAGIDNGYAGAQARLEIKNDELTLNADLELTELVFRTYEGDDQLLGLNAGKILALLKDSSGSLSIPLALKWNIKDPSVKLKDVFRESITQSLKSTIFGSVGNIVENAIKKIGEEGFDSGKGDIEGTIKQLKNLFK